jgi:hypothetical protein
MSRSRGSDARSSMIVGSTCSRIAGIAPSITRGMTSLIR